MSGFTAPRYNVDIEVEMFDDISMCEDLSKFTIDDITPWFVGATFKLSGLSFEAFRDKCKTFVPKAVPLPDAIAQNEDYNIALPFIWLFVFTSCLKQQKEKSLYLGNKFLGVSRAAEQMKIYYCVTEADAAKIVPKIEILAHLKGWLDMHPHFRAYITRLALGYANTDADVASSVTMYAIEAVKSIQHIYQNGCEMIENGILEPNHPIMNIPQVKSYIDIYMDNYKEPMIEIYGSNWIYGALLDFQRWNEFKTTSAFKHLWILGAIILSETDANFSKITVDKKYAMEWATKRPYCDIIAQGNAMKSRVLVPVAGYDRRSLASVEKLFNRRASDKKRAATGAKEDKGYETDQS